MLLLENALLGLLEHVAGQLGTIVQKVKKIRDKVWDVKKDRRKMMRSNGGGANKGEEGGRERSQSRGEREEVKEQEEKWRRR